MQSNFFIKAIKKALNNSYNLKSNIRNWSEVNLIELYQSRNNDYIEVFKDAYDNFKRTIWGVIFFNLFGEYILENKINNKIKVLDIGSGRSLMFQNIVNGNNPKDNFEYTSIDNKNESLLSKECNDMKRYHIKADIFNDIIFLSENFDILIIDIEPHSREIEIYNKFSKYLSETHLVILQCIGNMDLYGSSLADKFIDHYLREEKIIDYLAINEINYLIRDVLIVLSKTSCKFQGDICNFIKSDGGKFTTYSDLNIKNYVCEPSQIIINKLLHGK